MDMRNYELEEAQNQVVLSENRLNEARQLPFGTAIGRLGEWPALALTPGELQVAPDSVREDIAALQKQLESLKAQAELGHEATKPSLDIFGNVLLQGQDQNLQPALASSATTNYPTFYAGVKLSVPLDRVTVSEAAEAAEARRVAAEEMLRRRQYEAGRERENVLLRLAQIQKQFALAGTLVESQQRKLSEEAKRVRIGRSSTFQVLIFEQEALEAEKLLLRNRLALIESHLRLEIFRAIEGV
jgi:outer membrane protein TolC